MRNSKSTSLTASLLLLLSVAVSCFAAQKESKAKLAYTDPDKTDADFAIQGEYAGEIQTGEGSRQIGVQVIARGDGNFQAVAYQGGLPGDGWNGEQPIRVDGKRDGETVKFQGDGGAGIYRNGAIHIQDDSAAPLGKLARVNRASPTLGQKPPAGAVVLFDGRSADQWQGGRMTEDGLLMEGATSKRQFGSHRLHIEFRLPYQPYARGQGRGNSGIYLQGRYEVQMLDSFGLEGKNNECGGLYSVKDPDVNMCFPPLSWQTFDIDYTAARYDDQGKRVANPRVTVRHNGVVTHNDVELPGERSTTAAPTKPGPTPGPVFLQNHRNPVRYRNIWVVEKDA